MTEWIKTTLRPLLLDSRDGEWGHSQSTPETETLSVIRGTDFADVRVGHLADLPKRHLFKHHAERKRLEPWDIIIETAGGSKDRPTGRTLLIKPETIAQLSGLVTCASFARFLRVDPHRAAPRYLFWLLQHLYHSRQLLQFHTQHTGVARFQFTTFADTFLLNLPPLKHQQRIASVLSSYDDLIENNTRRIAILEEMARRLFKEWFVHFQFPGSGHRTFAKRNGDTIPSAWVMTTLADVLTMLESGSRPKGGIKIGDGEVPSIGAENVNGLGSYDYEKEKLIPRAFFDAMRRGIVKSGDVLLYKDGAHVGRKAMFRDGYPHSECAVNEHVFILRTDVRLCSAYLYFWLDQPSMTQKIKSLNANAAQPGLNQPGVKSLPILLPTKDVMRKFDITVEPYLALLFNLAKAIHRLRTARDLLLPKLISGEIDVSAPSAAAEVAAA